MASTRKALTGRRGWTVVAGLTTALTVLVAGQAARRLGAGPAALPVGGALGALVPRCAPPPARRSRRSCARSSPPPPRRLRGNAATTSAADRTSTGRTAPQPSPEPSHAAPCSASSARRWPSRPCPASARTGWQQRRGAGRARLAASRRSRPHRLPHRVQGARSGYMGLTHLNQRRIEISSAPAAAQLTLLRHVMAHELGHAYDTVRNNAAIRASWMATRGIPASTPWTAAAAAPTSPAPAGDFAKVYAQWARGASTNRCQLGDVPPAQPARSPTASSAPDHASSASAAGRSPAAAALDGVHRLIGQRSTWSAERPSASGHADADARLDGPVRQRAAAVGRLPRARAASASAAALVSTDSVTRGTRHRPSARRCPRRYRPPQPFGHRLQDLVARGVPQAVVDRLELVHVHNRTAPCCRRRATACCSRSTSTDGSASP